MMPQHTHQTRGAGHPRPRRWVIAGLAVVAALGSLVGTSPAYAQPAAAPTAATPTSAPPSKPAGLGLLDKLDPGAKATAAPPTRGVDAAWDVPAAPPEPMWPHVELHGYLRTRLDVIRNGHLGQAVARDDGSPVPLTGGAILPPLSDWPTNNNETDNPFADSVGSSRDDKGTAGANMRLRLAPRVHLGPKTFIHTTIDVVDNHLFGSQPDYAGALQRPDVPLVAFTDTSRPISPRVVEAYGAWDTFLGEIRVGRMGWHWGLGILANAGMGSSWHGAEPLDWFGEELTPGDGSGYDADFGTFVDRAQFTMQFGKVRATAMYDWVSQGVIDPDRSRPDGLFRDLGNADDARQVAFALTSSPSGPDEVKARKRQLTDLRRSVFDWGLLGLYRWQDLAVDAGGAAPQDVTSEQLGQGSVRLYPRGARVLTADAWLRWETRPGFGERWVIMGEFAYTRGAIDNVNASADDQPESSRDLQMFGAAAKIAWQDEALGFYMDLGVASGDDTGCSGYYAPRECVLNRQDGTANSDITGFRFHRNYRVDTLLFRELIGGVTNAWYARPAFSVNAHPFYGDDLLGMEISLLHARPLNIDGVSGSQGGYGTEAAARVYAGQRGLAFGSVTFAYTFIGRAMDVKSGWFGALNSDAAENAWRLLTHLTLMF